ncbi:MAG: EamA family transporter [Chloroflexota bacterium]
MLLNWANAAILSAAILAAVNTVDSHLITKRMPSLRAFLILPAVIAAIYGGIILYRFPIPQGVDTVPILFAIASALLRSAGIALFLFMMQTEEVSRIMPVVNTHPVFVAILAVPLLGEALIHLEWTAIFITVAGAVLISIKPGVSLVKTWLGKPLIFPLAASLFLAGANLTSKYALEHISFWNMYAIGALGMAFIFLALALRPATIRQFRNIDRPRSTLSIQVCNESLVPIAAIFLYWAIQNGPVSLVSTIAGAQPVFVFIYAFILSRISSTFLLEQSMGKETMALRIVSIAMIVAGVTIIHLV